MGTRNDDISLKLAKAVKQGFLPDVSDAEVDILTVEAKVLFGNDLALVSCKGDIPAGLGWNTTGYTIVPEISTLRNGTQIGSAGITAKEIFATFSTAQTAPVNRYYASPNGSDANTGAYDQPWRSIKKCIDAANAAGQPARILVTSGSYLDGNGFEGTSPTVDTAFIAAGGVVTVSNGIATSAYNFAVHATFTKTYYINPTPTGGVSRVLDLTRVDKFGNFVELVKVSSDTICNETPDSYYEGPALYIHRKDGAQPTATNTRVLRTKDNFILTSEKNVYVGSEDNSPWILEGSANSNAIADPGGVAVYIQTPTNVSRKAFIMENVRQDFAGETTAGSNSFTVDRWNGLAAFFNCQGNAPSKDAFNFHNISNLASNMQVLTVNCSATDTGRMIQSCNGYTLHENVKGIDIAGRYFQGRGGTVHNINASKCYLLGTHVEGDLGDFVAGGAIYPNAVRVADTSEMWCERVTIEMPPGTFSYRTVSGTAKIHKRDCEPTRQLDAGPGTIDTY